MINIRDITGWIARNVKDKQDNGDELAVFLRPVGLRVIYMLFYYEYVRYAISKQEGEKKIPITETDTEINIPEKMFVYLLQVFFDKHSNNYLMNISNL
jgi:hypothetical protein